MSKRSVDYSDKTNKRSFAYNPVMKTISPDRYYDWGSLIYKQNRDVQEIVTKSKQNTSKQTTSRIVPITIKLISKLGVRVLHDRRLCFGGRALQGIFLPGNTSLQILLVKRFLVWYSPCVQIKKNVYEMNKYCFARREKDFLKMYLRSIGYRHYLWNPLLPAHFYKPL